MRAISNMAKPIQKIDWDSIVKSGEQGYQYCVTDPPHPQGESRGDRKRKYVYLHRAVMENELGRYLKPGEEVDHKDGDVTNNDPSNLELRHAGEHQREHALNGNSFWKKSPRNKPKDASVTRVLRLYVG
jgi:hypothetical protein